MTDRLVTRSMYREAYGISDETVRRDLKAGRLPPFDEAPTRKRQAWYASTLVRAGKLLFAVHACNCAYARPFRPRELCRRSYSSRQSASWNRRPVMGSPQP